MLKKFSLKTLFVIGLAFIGHTAFASGVTYQGDITDSQHSQTTGEDAATTGASATIEMDYSIPEVVALGIYTDGDINSTNGAPLLAGKYNWATSMAASVGYPSANSRLSITNQDDILNDIIKSGNEVDHQTNQESFIVAGVVYSSTGAGTLEIIPGTVGGTENLPLGSTSVAFTNQSGGSGSIDVAFNGVFWGNANGFMVGTANSLTNGPNTAMDSTNRANFLLLGDVIESSVNNQDDSGTYTGSFTVTITAL